MEPYLKQIRPDAIIDLKKIVRATYVPVVTKTDTPSLALELTDGITEMLYGSEAEQLWNELKADAYHG